MSRKITIIDYGSGNLQSVLNAFELVSTDSDIQISNNINDIKSSTHLVLPGVGSFKDCMSGLLKKEELIKEILNQITLKKKPFFGICVGMQVLAKIGFENGQVAGLDLVEGEVRAIVGKNLKVPHMGWNNIAIKNSSHPVIKGIKNGEHFYFANSYHFQTSESTNLIASADYGQAIAAIIAKDNIFATQFHPEKSGDSGLKIIKNFTQWKYPN